MSNENTVRSFVDLDRLPDKYPTHRHEAVFWEDLGRAVATFGFLEEVLGKAIFALTATRPYDQVEIQQAYEAWLPQLERALMDPLGRLIDAYDKALRDHPDKTIANTDKLLCDLRKAPEMRKILCHGSWRPPNAGGASVPFFVNRQKLVFDTSMDHNFLAQVQRHTAELACAIMNTVTQMGWQFPGSKSPGKAIWMDRPSA